MRGLRVFAGLLALALLAAVLGCTTQSPLDSTNFMGQTLVVTADPPENRVQFTDVIATIDADQRLLTFEESAYTVKVLEDCSIVAVQGGVETPLEFADLAVGDLVKICGIEQTEFVVAHKIVVYVGGECDGFDLIFQDSIATIDYAGGSFTVFGRTETIVITENTVIWGKIPYANSPGPYCEKDPATTGNNGTTNDEPRRERNRYAVDTIFAFTDLQPGWILEIKANIIDENTLEAFDIKVVGANFQNAERFEDVLASVDVDNGIVTFETEAWIGTICSGASLLDADGNPLTLADFAAGDAVTVKGVALTEDTLRVCEMIKQ